MKINKFNESNIQGFRLLEVDSLEFDKLSPNYIMENSSIEISVDHSHVFSNIPEEDILVLYSDINAFVEDVFNHELVFFAKSQNENTPLEFLNTSDFDTISLSFENGTDKNTMINVLNSINPLIQNKVDKIFGIDNEILLKEKNDQDLSDQLIDLENGIMERVTKRIKNEQPKGYSSILLNSINAPSRYNTNNPDYSQVDKHQSLTFPIKRMTSGTQYERNQYDTNENRKIQDKLDAISEESGFLKEYHIDCNWKFRYKLELSQKGLDYLHKIKEDATKEYYKENNLDPKTHYKKEKRKIKNQP